MANHKQLLCLLNRIGDTIAHLDDSSDEEIKEYFGDVDEMKCAFLNELYDVDHTIKVFLSELRIEIAKENNPELWSE